MSSAVYLKSYLLLFLCQVLRCCISVLLFYLPTLSFSSGWQSGTDGRVVALQQEGCTFVFRLFCVGFACFSCAQVGFLWVLFSSTEQNHAPQQARINGPLWVSLLHKETIKVFCEARGGEDQSVQNAVEVRCIDYLTLSLNESESVTGCLYVALWWTCNLSRLNSPLLTVTAGDRHQLSMSQKGENCVKKKGRLTDQLINLVWIDIST